MYEAIRKRKFCFVIVYRLLNKYILVGLTQRRFPLKTLMLNGIRVEIVSQEKDKRKAGYAIISAYDTIDSGPLPMGLQLKGLSL